MQTWKPMWEKSQEKKRAGKRHARNFASGYVKIDEYHLLRTGLRGRKRWLFCCGASLLLLIAVGNLVLNCLLLSVLDIRHNGLPYMVLGSNNRVIFPLSLRSSLVQLMNGVSSYDNASTSITSSSLVILSSGPLRIEQGSSTILNSSQIFLDRDLARFRPYESFEIYDKTNQLLISINETKSVFQSSLSMLSLDASRIAAKSIMTESISGIRTTLSADSLQANSEKNIAIKSTQDSIRAYATDYVTLDARNGIHFPSIPVSNGNSAGTSSNYQLCVCNNGKLFRVPETCSRANEITDPCEL
ncbi:PREDICTED: beta-sarcoglycan-like [Amphimedon queenslandica]|uniref:Beta-sarcoglycan n=1 Tax=Amphimedon queenslandica TaxID=400682 RepID=A0A1X7VPL3_AMPQE|nr:PREDICTED: beta-sarcoglycan-like [Amphimedon queenslandica]|eukprot:XP_011409763.1 PREDICTED: beta-sarcoglycan-like [Amphimedon queenslandica]